MEKDRAAAEEQLATQVSALVRLMHPLKSALSREVGAAIPDRSAMLLLFPLMQGPQRAGALAELSHADPSTVSRQVAELVRRGLVERAADPSDGRASLLAITPAGREACERVRVVRRQMLAVAAGGWTDAELATFTGLLQRFTAALGAAYGAPPSRPPALAGTVRTQTAADTNQDIA